MLSDDLREAIERATQEARRAQHEFVTLGHLLLALLDEPRAGEALDAVGIDRQELRQALQRHLGTLEALAIRGTYEPIQTIAFRRVLNRATTHVQASSERGPVHGGHVLVAMFAEPEDPAVALLHERGVERLDVVAFLSHGKRKDGRRRSVSPAGAEEGGQSFTPEDALQSFTVDLYARAQEGKIDPLIGREHELNRAIHVLARRRKNNPLFVGDSGVGKTAIVEGLALAITRGEVPELLEGVHIYALDMGALMAGTR